MAKRKKQKSQVQYNIDLAETTAGRMLENVKARRGTKLNVRETALVLNLMGYAIRKMTEELQEAQKADLDIQDTEASEVLDE